MRARRCKSQHRKMWLVGGGFWAWCYECGAIRKMRRVTHTRPDNSAIPSVEFDLSDPDGKRWVYPVGPDGDNPASKSYERDGGSK